MPQRKRSTLKDLARRLGVHFSTVSRAINPQTRHMISADVAGRVLEAAAEHGYRPNRMASSLRTRRSHTIGVVLPDICNPVYPPILLGIEKVLLQNGYVALVANAGSDRAQQRFVVDQMLARQVEGLILATVTRRDPVLAHCLEDGIAVITVNRSADKGEVPGVVSDDRLGMRLTVEHLAGLGHRHIAHIAGPQTLSTGHLRKQGFVAARTAELLDAGLKPVHQIAQFRSLVGQVAAFQNIAKPFQRNGAARLDPPFEREHQIFVAAAQVSPRHG